MTRFKNVKIAIETIDHEVIKINTKDITSMDRNFVDLTSMSNREWLRDGKFKHDYSYELTPESLASLLRTLEVQEDKLKFGLNSSRAFLERYPTMEKYKVAIAKTDALPKDERELL